MTVFAFSVFVLSSMQILSINELPKTCVFCSSIMTDELKEKLLSCLTPSSKKTVFSSCSNPAIKFKSVLFPEPLIPVTSILSPALNTNSSMLIHFLPCFVIEVFCIVSESKEIFAVCFTGTFSMLTNLFRIESDDIIPAYFSPII